MSIDSWPISVTGYPSCLVFDIHYPTLIWCYSQFLFFFPAGKRRATLWNFLCDIEILVIPKDSPTLSCSCRKIAQFDLSEGRPINMMQFNTTRVVVLCMIYIFKCSGRGITDCTLHGNIASVQSCFLLSHMMTYCRYCSRPESQVKLDSSDHCNLIYYSVSKQLKA